jgi:hypothetical protein
MSNIKRAGMMLKGVYVDTAIVIIYGATRVYLVAIFMLRRPQL